MPFSDEDLSVMRTAEDSYYRDHPELRRNMGLSGKVETWDRWTRFATQAEALSAEGKSFDPADVSSYLHTRATIHELMVYVRALSPTLADRIDTIVRESDERYARLLQPLESRILLTKDKPWHDDPRQAFFLHGYPCTLDRSEHLPLLRLKRPPV